MRKNNLWNRIFFKKEIRKNMKDAELQLTLSKHGTRIIKAIEKCDSLYELMDIHKKAWAIGFQNVYLGPDRYGMFRTESIPTMRPEEVFLGNIWGLSTHTIPFWEERKSQLYGCNGFGIDPETSLYSIILGQYKKLLDFNLIQIWNKAVILSITYKKNRLSKMKRKHQFHRENCANTIRETFKDMFDRTIVLAGKHAFEWSIMVCDHGVVTRVTFSCREDARREYTRLKKLK